MWLLVVGLAVVGGIGLRFIQLPDVMLPVAVGVAVTAAVVLLLLLLQTTTGAPAVKPGPTLQAALPTAAPQKAADNQKDAAARLAALTRPSSSGPSQRPRRR